MIRFIKKGFNYILTGSFTLVFAACYGSQMALENPKLINTKDKNGTPIPGLKVTLFEGQTQINEKFTDENGAVEFYVSQNNDVAYKATVEDIDGVENLGDFQSKEIDLTNESYFELKLTKKQ
jgi:hypothetical protein